MKNFQDLTFEEKQELAKYLINNWDYQENEEDEIQLEFSFEIAINNIAEGKNVKWAKTPSIYADELIEECAQ